MSAQLVEVEPDNWINLSLVTSIYPHADTPQWTVIAFGAVCIVVRISVEKVIALFDVQEYLRG